MRPFFRPARRELHVHHGEATGMTVGPVILGITGLIFGLAPGLVAKSLIQPAASAIYGEPLDASFYLWHGLTPMLALSALVVALGLLLGEILGIRSISPCAVGASSTACSRIAVITGCWTAPLRWHAGRRCGCRTAICASIPW